MPAKRRRISPWQFCVLLYGTLGIINVAVHFPWATDHQASPAERYRASAEFYREAYAAPTAPTPQEQAREERYVRVAEAAAKAYDIEGMVRRFVSQYGLRDRRILDVGAGRGYLQDMVQNYVGLDISPTAQRYFHKPFVLASATAMPFKDNEFDGAWSIWVLEHIPNPESALLEMRRVVRPGGLILLMPAWFCPSWAADGYAVRPFSDFGLAGKLAKMSLLLRTSSTFQASYILPSRSLRYLASKAAPGPTRFHYARLTPNYKEYWQNDSDAVNSMDPYEAILWFKTRGDACLNCPGGWSDLKSAPETLIIRLGSKR
jgi:SAM-dependent methyltransferase